MNLSELTPPNGRKSYTVAWLAWIAAFFAIEVPPIVQNRSVDTLSDHVWLWFGIPQHTPPDLHLRARRLALLTLLAWLAAHFLTGDDV